MSRSTCARGRPATRRSTSRCRLPTAGSVIGQTRVTVRSTAFSGVGVVLSVGAGTFLALWWGRHILTARRGRRRPRHAAAEPTWPVLTP